MPVGPGCGRAGEAIAALLASTADLEGEILLAEPDGGAANGIPDSTRVRRITAPASSNAAGLRTAGIRESRAPIVALVEPWAIAEPGWGRAILEGHARAGPGAAVGGPVLYGGRGGPVSLAEFFFEYGVFLPPLPAETDELPVNNVSYPRELLETFRGDWAAGFWKHFVHRRMKVAGVRFFAEPAAAVRHVRETPLPAFCRERVHHGRAYAARRGSGPWRAMSVPVLPFVLAGRIARKVWTRPGARTLFLRSLAPLLAAEGAWAFGEALGYLAGDGGSSSRVF